MLVLIVLASLTVATGCGEFDYAGVWRDSRSGALALKITLVDGQWIVTDSLGSSFRYDERDGRLVKVQGAPGSLVVRGERLVWVEEGYELTTLVRASGVPSTWPERGLFRAYLRAMRGPVEAHGDIGDLLSNWPYTPREKSLTTARRLSAAMDPAQDIIAPASIGRAHARLVEKMEECQVALSALAKTHGSEASIEDLDDSFMASLPFAETWGARALALSEELGVCVPDYWLLLVAPLD